jgi:hypothetical protein
MVRIAIYLVFALLACQEAKGQTSAERDSLARLLFERRDWQAVRQNSKEAMAQGFTTYAFVFRLALAELEQGRWVHAEKHLRQAIALNPIDNTPVALLAALLQKLGRTEEAALYKPMPFYMQAGIEGGLEAPDTDSLGNLGYQGAYLKHPLYASASLTHAFTRLNQSVYWGDFTQLQYYIAYRQAFRGGWLLTLGAHFLRFSGNILFDSSQFNNGGDLVALELSKQFGPIGLAPQYSIATLYGRTQQQLGLKLSVFPARFAAVRYDLNPMFNRDSSASASALSQALHWFPSARVHFALTHYVGNGYNFQEQAGYLVNNGINLTRSRWGGYIEYGFHQRWRMFLLYQYESGTERFFNFDYHYNSVFLGLKFQ